MDEPSSGTTPATVDLGVFAHDEAETIGGLVAAIGAQTIATDPEVDLRVLILANGCRDATVAEAEAARSALVPALRDRVEVLDLAEGGKSRTAHRFVHALSRPGAEFLIFIDADVTLVAPDTLSRMVGRIRARPELEVFSSRPVKDVHFGTAAGPAARLIASGGDGLSDFRTSICGQLFVARAATMRRIGVPAGLPVEDGFYRAMILTDLLSGPERLERLDGDPEIFHVYESIRTVGELLRHQTRLVVGSAVNAALYRLIRREAPSREAAEALLKRAAEDDAWLSRTLSRELPRAPYGYVPFEFLVKRLRVARRRGWPGAKGVLVLGLGLMLDVVVYVQASARMMLRPSAGHW
jgi:hypothetical protein